MFAGSLFAGIGGLDLGLERAGFKIIWQVERDKFCQQVLRTHWPGVTLYDDVREVGRKNLIPVDLIAGGFPCQDLSIAGKRAGLDGERSNLWYEFARIIDELAPAWVLIENVPGLLSSRRGNDLRIILQWLVERRYGVAWRVLDSQYFGLAQQRKRVFIVGSLGNMCAAQVLFESACVCGNPPPGRKARQNSSRHLAPCLRASGCGTARMGDARGQDPVVAMTLNAKNRIDGESETFIPGKFTHTSRGFNQKWVVRRLTPTECERLQGFPDGWTACAGLTDSARYRILGNAVSVPVAEWIGKRILSNDGHIPQWGNCPKAADFK